jgi:radical SAM superfamily enzyme YgiQ (UPF0313 family)
MKLTLIHPCIGRIPGKNYIRAWQMEPLPIAQIVAVTPAGIEIAFWDDRMEKIPFDEPTDLVAISVETYTARRAYEIASEYRKREIPVIMGGFHPTLCPDEAMEYAECIVTGEAEMIWPEILSDFQNGKMKRHYRGVSCLDTCKIIPDRSVFKGKRYLKIGLIEAGRGCRFSCEFCSIRQFFEGKHTYRDPGAVLEEINLLRKKLGVFFFVDDNITANPERAKELFRTLIPMRIKWVGQSDINIAKDDEMMDLMVRSGCQALLIGFESFNREDLKAMHKSFNPGIEEAELAVSRIHKAGIWLYPTFIFGYEKNSLNEIRKILEFSLRNKLFIVAFNHLTPFPGTELYERLKRENMLLYDKWWLEKNYKYGQIPFKTPTDFRTVELACFEARKSFYSIPSIFQRFSNPVNNRSWFAMRSYLLINFLMRREVSKRMSYPLGDLSYKGELVKVKV